MLPYRRPLEPNTKPLQSQKSIEELKQELTVLIAETQAAADKAQKDAEKAGKVDLATYCAYKWMETVELDIERRLSNTNNNNNAPTQPAPMETSKEEKKSNDQDRFNLVPCKWDDDELIFSDIKEQESYHRFSARVRQHFKKSLGNSTDIKVERYDDRCSIKDPHKELLLKMSQHIGFELIWATAKENEAYFSALLQQSKEGPAKPKNKSKQKKLSKKEIKQNKEHKAQEQGFIFSAQNINQKKAEDFIKKLVEKYNQEKSPNNPHKIGIMTTRNVYFYPHKARLRHQIKAVKDDRRVWTEFVCHDPAIVADFIRWTTKQYCFLFDYNSIITAFKKAELTKYLDKGDLELQAQLFPVKEPFPISNASSASNSAQDSASNSNNSRQQPADLMNAHQEQTAGLTLLAEASASQSFPPFLAMPSAAPVFQPFLPLPFTPLPLPLPLPLLPPSALFPPLPSLPAHSTLFARGTKRNSPAPSVDIPPAEQGAEKKSKRG